MTPKEALKKADAAFKAGDPMLALKYYRAVLARVPRHSAALKGVRKIEKRFELPPVSQQDFDAAVQMLQQQNFAGTETFVNSLILRNPALHGLYNVRGLAEASQGKDTAAIASFRKALDVDPTSAEAANNLGLKLKETGDLDEAEKVLRLVVSQQPRYVQARYNLATVLEQKDLLDEAGQGYSKVLEQSPSMALAWLAQGKLQAVRGDNEQALVSLEAAIKHDPNGFEAYVLRTRLKKFDEADGFADKMAAMAVEVARPVLERAQLHFGLGKMFEDLADYATSFTHYEAANILQKGLVPYSERETQAAFASIKAAYAKPAAIAPLTEAQRPVFIVGMNRSGTSLVEQMLAAHPMVHGCGELEAIGDFAEQLGANHAAADPQKLAGFAASYRALLASKTDLPVVTDKMPINFKWIGLIRTLFADAKIIYLDREARDVCFSNFKASFESVGHMYCYDQRDLARYFGLHKNLMLHWSEIYPDGFFNLNYQDLIAQPETTARALLEYVGLPWDDAVLDFHKSKRAVKTLSQAQVRSQIYATSVGAWQNYEPYLGPMLAELTPE